MWGLNQKSCEKYLSNLGLGESEYICAHSDLLTYFNFQTLLECFISQTELVFYCLIKS